jgi:hypothetical protein
MADFAIGKESETWAILQILRSAGINRKSLKKTAG